MNDSQNQEEWFTLDDASQRFKNMFNRDTMEACQRYLLDSAVKGHLQLSVYFSKPVIALKGVFLTREEADGKRISSCCREPGSNRDVTSSEGKNFWERLGLENYVFAYTDLGEEENAAHKIEYISGVWDLAMVGNERIQVENLNRALIGESQIVGDIIDGWYIKRSPGDFLWEVQSELHPKNGDGFDTVICPVNECPAEGMIVVRTSSLLSLREKLGDLNDKEFESLTDQLADYFNKDLHQLPKGMRQRIEQEPPLLWDTMSPAQRLSWAQKADYQNNPANDEQKEYWFNHYVEKRAKESELARVKAPTYIDPDKIEKQRAECQRLQSELDFMFLQERYPDAPRRILEEHHFGTGTTEELERILNDPATLAATLKTLEDIDNGQRKRFEDIQYTDDHGQSLNGDNTAMSDQEESAIIGKVLLEAEFFPVTWVTIKKWLRKKGVNDPPQGEVWKASESVCREIKAERRAFIQRKRKNVK